MGRGFIGYPKGRNRDIKLAKLIMFKNDAYKYV